MVFRAVSRELTLVLPVRKIDVCLLDSSMGQYKQVALAARVTFRH